MREKKLEKVSCIPGNKCGEKKGEENERKILRWRKKRRGNEEGKKKRGGVEGKKERRGVEGKKKKKWCTENITSHSHTHTQGG